MKQGHSRSSFLPQDFWQTPRADMPYPMRIFRLGLQQIFLVFRYFIADRCMMRAAALTYTSLLAMVPFLALVFSLLKTFGVQNMIKPLLLDQLAVGGQEAVSAVVGYINNTNVGQLGTFGFLILLVTIYSLLSQVEKSFNAVCGGLRDRSLFRRFGDYFSVGFLGLLFLVSAISMTTTVKNQALVQRLIEMDYVGQVILLSLKLVPFVAMWLAFILMYTFLPNARIRLRAALVGGIIGGTIWQVAQYAYIGLQVGVANYNAIYGTLAALPILMVWIQVSWVIVLFGLEVVFVTQNFQSIRQEQQQGRLSVAASEELALMLMVKIGAYFNCGKAPGLDQLANDLCVPVRQVQIVLALLEEVGLVAQVELAGEEEGFQLAQSPTTLSLDGLMARIRHHGLPLMTDEEGTQQDHPTLAGVFSADGTLAPAVKEQTLDTLISQLEEAGEGV